MSAVPQIPIFTKEVATNAGNVVLDDGSVAGAPKRAANVIKVLATAGALVVVWENGSTSTYTGLAVGEEILGHFKQITDAGSDVTSVRVSWLS